MNNKLLHVGYYITVIFLVCSWVGIVSINDPRVVFRISVAALALVISLAGLAYSAASNSNKKPNRVAFKSSGYWFICSLFALIPLLLVAGFATLEPVNEFRLGGYSQHFEVGYGALCGMFYGCGFVYMSLGLKELLKVDLE